MIKNLAIVLLVAALIIGPAYSGPTYVRKWHVHVVNEMSPKTLLFVHCKSGTRDLHLQTVSTGTEFQWTFHSDMFGRTVYWCYWRPDKGDIHANFKVFWDNNDLYRKCNYRNCIWVAKDLGLYLRDIPDGYDEFRYNWLPGGSIDKNYTTINSYA
ncbi:hypothetical protein Dsin_014973 [Dipteronia sinensis]|uniref:S-protein homolog n=1 Tax=Dipteronia sinensis TaxID=43782 RepID=A0AAE0EAB1_9ROSI|nr:hypothetical protein Dsin_014973 [Dipteronia sinensis]